MFCCVVQSDDACNPDRMYDLISVVIHCGSGLSRGHYISIVKSHGMWVLFDDDIVDVSSLVILSLCHLLTDVLVCVDVVVYTQTIHIEHCCLPFLSMPRIMIIILTDFDWASIK